MKLYRLKINWIPFDENAAYTDAELNGNQPLRASETPLDANDYDDISSIENWNIHGKKLRKDYKRWRDHLGRVAKDMAVATTLGTVSNSISIILPNIWDKYLVWPNALNLFLWKEEKIAIWNGTNWDFKEKQEVGFDLCTPTEKLILTEHKFGTHAQRVATVWFTNTVLFWLAYNKKAIEVRQMRLAVAHWYIHNYLPNNAKDLFGWTDSSEVEVVVNRYVSYGIEWVLAGDGCSGISDRLFGLWLYTWIWFINKPRTPENGITMSQLAASAWDVIHNWNY